MTSAASAAEAAVYAALNVPAVIDLLPGLSVHQHVPQDTPPPVIIVGDIEGEPMGAKGDIDRELRMSIVTVVEGEARKPVLDVMEGIAASLDGKVLTAGGWSLHPVLESEDALLLPEGNAYVGTSRFIIYALQ